jgi:hypothetical protein
LLEGAQANRDATCRQGSIDVVGPVGRLIATGDLHDNPLHFMRLVELAGMTGKSELAHLTLHEIIHPDQLLGEVDFSYRALTRVARLKADYPEFVHVLLANHELAQIIGSGIVKNGIRVVEAFNDGIDHTFGTDAHLVVDAIEVFVRSMPIALRCHTPRGDILCAHSLPAAAAMGRFDTSILERDLTEDDLAPRRGSAHLMIWGRDYDAEQLEDLVERWGVVMFILGHQHVPNGIELVRPNAIVLNSDHERGVYLEINLDNPPSPEECLGLARMIALPFQAD